MTIDIIALLLAAVRRATEHTSFKQLRRAIEWAQLQFDVTLAKALTRTPVDNTVVQSDSKMSSQTAESITAWLKKRIADEFDLESEAIDTHKSFLEYGLDSVTAVTFAFELEEWLGHKLSSILLWEYPTITALAQHLAEKTDTSLSAVEVDLHSRENPQDSQILITDKIGQGDAEQLFAKLEQLSEQKVDALLGEILIAEEVGK